MKVALPLVILLFSLSCCSQEKTKTNEHQTQNDDQLFGNELIDNDFLLFADSSLLDSLASQIKNSFYIYDESNNKILHLDAEALAEFHFDFFLPQLKVMLGKRNFRLDVRTAEHYETSNEILINGQRIRLYTKDEMENKDFWDLASRRFFRGLNEQLARQDMKESFFLLYQGNDLHAFLLTDKQQSIIAERYRAEPKEIPYKP